MTTVVFLTKSSIVTVRSTRMKQVYCCIPESMQTKEADPFAYKLRSKAEVKEQMKYTPPNFVFKTLYKGYTSGDLRRNDPANLDDRDRVSKISFDLRDMNL